MRETVGLAFVALFALVISMHPAFGQEVQTSNQTTISKDLENNPVAQDILKKIEQTKQWIAELQQRDYDRLEAQKELDAKRAQALDKLNHDLEEWEKLWEYYSPRTSFGRFVEKVPDNVKGVFWDQFEFKELKVNAGRDALKKVIANGGSLQAARQAYLSAAETKRIELIETNSMFNVNHNLAYYNQQLLFDREGQLQDTPLTGEQLRKYYEDYRSNPEYLKANPDDVVSWEDLGKTTPHTECRDGYVVVYRFHAQDYVCVTMYTAEMWIRQGMGEITGSTENQLDTENLVTPLTKCDDGFVVVRTLASDKYSCVQQDTANKWIDDGVAEIPNPDKYIMDRISDKEASLKIQNINKKIQEFELELQEKQVELKNNFEKKYADALVLSQENEKKAVKDYNERSGMSKEELSNKLVSIRKQYESTQDDILQEKIDSMKTLEKTYQNMVKDFVDDYQFDKDIKVIWNSAKPGYEAVKP